MMGRPRKNPLPVSAVEIFVDRSSQYRWTALDATGRKVADSKEGYPTRSWAKQAARIAYPEARIR